MGEEEAFDMAAARKLWEQKNVTRKKADRKSQRKKIVASVDKRSLRATGRTEQFNFRSTPELKAKAHAAASAAGMALAEWMELAVEAYLAQDQGQSGA